MNPRLVAALVGTGAVAVIIGGVAVAVTHDDRGGSAAARPEPTFAGLPTPAPRPTGATSPTASPTPDLVPGSSPPTATSALPTGTPAPAVTSAGADAPKAVVDGYYAALARDDAAGAFGRLCSEATGGGLAPYAAAVQRNRATGTAITSWRALAQPVVRGDQAVVRGHLELDRADGTDITVGLLLEDGAWRVCGSDLGGILLPAGTGSGGVTT